MRAILQSEICDRIIDHVYFCALQESIEFNTLQIELSEHERREDPYYHRHFRGGHSESWDTTTLKACSLVCKAWVSRCRFHLFAKFTRAYGSNLDERVRAFAAIAPDLRHIHLRERLVTYHSLPKLAIFRHLVSLELGRVSLHMDFLAGVLRNFSEIKHLVLRDCDVLSSTWFIRALLACPNLESLVFRRFIPIVHQEVLPAFSVQEALPQLRSLLFSTCHSDAWVTRLGSPATNLGLGLLEWLLSFNAKSPLTNLGITMVCANHIPFIARALCVLAPSLQCLRLGFDNFWRTASIFHDNVDLGIMTQLRSIRLDHVTHFQKGVGKANFSFYVPLILGQISSCYMEEVTISANILDFRDLDDIYLTDMEIILERPNFQGLRKLRFQLMTPEEHDVAGAMEYLRQKLPGCNSRGILTVDYYVSFGYP